MNFKDKKDMELFFKLHPALMLILCDMNNYAYEKHNINLVITDTISTESEDASLGRVSDAHRTRRAADIRANNLDTFIVADIVNYINTKPEYEQYRYLSNSGKYRLAYMHGDNDNFHIHVSIHSGYRLPLLNQGYIAKFKDLFIGL